MKISSTQYAQTLYELVQDKEDQVAIDIIKKFAKILVQNNDVGKRNKIIESFKKIWNLKKSIVEADVVSAKELDQEITSLIRAHVSKLSGAKEINIKQEVDKNILGGIIIKYGDRIIDGSLKKRIGEIKERIIRI